jgi:hypothetical protein
MCPYRIKYLRLIESEARNRGYFHNWVPFALKAAPVIADEIDASVNAKAFLRWLFNEPAAGVADVFPQSRTFSDRQLSIAA